MSDPNLHPVFQKIMEPFIPSSVKPEQTCDCLTNHVCDGTVAKFHVIGRSGTSYGTHAMCEWAVRNERRLGFTCVVVSS